MSDISELLKNIAPIAADPDGFDSVFDWHREVFQDGDTLAALAAEVMERFGKAEAIRLCDAARGRFAEAGEGRYEGSPLFAQAVIHDMTGKDFSRDLFAIAAAEKFAEHDRIKEAWQALELIDDLED